MGPIASSWTLAARPVLAVAVAIITALCTSGCTPMTPTTEGSYSAGALAPTGVLRVAINFGNPVLATRSSDGGEPRGVSADLARELARRLGVRPVFVTYASAGRVVDAGDGEAWDVAFLAVDPVRAEKLAFTQAYVRIEGTYLVPAGSPINQVDQIDRASVRISVDRGSAYDLFLTRQLKSAQLIRTDSPEAQLATFLGDHLEATAGVRQPLESFAAQRSDVRVLPGHFMEIDQAMCVPRARPVAQEELQRFVADMKASGFIKRSLAANGQSASLAAP